VRTWLAAPSTAFLTGLALAVSVYHSYLGTTVIVEDYVHGPGWKVTTLMVLRFAYVLCGGAGLFAILRISMGA
jgi:succinate dehydrogenase / fumarate reductase membrane anchor subunit